MRIYQQTTTKNKPEKVFATEQLAVAAEALVAQEAATVGALDACAVPRPIEHVQQKLVDDRQLAPGAHQHHFDADFRPIYALYTSEADTDALAPVELKRFLLITS